MEMRALGRSGLYVSALSFGAMTFGGVGQFAELGAVDDAAAGRLVGRCLDAGINLFDTADVYSDGRSEEILGRALGERRQDVVIATKGWARRGDGPNNIGASRGHLIRACEASLRRLGTDYIDLYQLHAFDEMTPLEETMRALDDLVRAGKVRYLGCSNYAGWHLMKALSVADKAGGARFISQQINYSLIQRAVEHELVPCGLDQGVGIIAYGPLGYGALTGKYRRGRAGPENVRGSVDRAFQGAERERLYDLVEVLISIGEAQNHPPAQVALNWVMDQPGVSTALVGARNEAQLNDNLAALNWRLTAEDRARLDRASAARLPYPYSHSLMFNGERPSYYAKFVAP